MNTASHKSTCGWLLKTGTGRQGICVVIHTVAQSNVLCCTGSSHKRGYILMCVGVDFRKKKTERLTALVSFIGCTYCGGEGAVR